MQSAGVPKLIILSSLYLVISFVYIALYYTTRQTGSIRSAIKDNFWEKIFICLLLNSAILKYQTAFHDADSFTVFLIVILADIDLFIKKIPSELLCLLFIYLSIRIIDTGSYHRLILGLSSYFLWIIFQKRLRMGLYDVLMIAALSLLTDNFKKLLLFYSAILILWGMAGVILQKVFNKSAAVKIPLVPVFTAALILMNIIQQGYLQ